MTIKMLKSKIHRLTVTGVDVDYEGSLELDVELIEAAGMRAYEAVDVLNLRSGDRLTTYLIAGEKGSRVCRLNGPAALRGVRGDLVIVVSYCGLTPEEVKTHKARHVFVDSRNDVAKIEDRG